MALTSTIDLLPELKPVFYRALQPGDRFTFARIRVKNSILSRRRKKGISQKSLLPEIGAEWQALSEAVKASWNTCAAYSSMKGWNLFVQDFCARRANDLSGLATPSIHHQSWVGCVRIDSPATAIKLVQIHPHYYYIDKKIPGTRSMYSPVLVDEDFGIPYTLGLSYKSELSPVGANPIARLIARFWYSYQGRDLFYDLSINIEHGEDWQTQTAEMNELKSIIIRYDLYLEIEDMQGVLYFDNIKSIHSGQNWARDHRSRDINQGFTRNFYQIPKHWSALVAPQGAAFESGYFDF